MTGWTDRQRHYILGNLIRSSRYYNHQINCDFYPPEMDFCPGLGTNLFSLEISVHTIPKHKGGLLTQFQLADSVLMIVSWQQEPLDDLLEVRCRRRVSLEYLGYLRLYHNTSPQFHMA
jgi:hypothetical protein